MERDRGPVFVVLLCLALAWLPLAGVAAWAERPW
jgi:hypothetical protein